MKKLFAFLVVLLLSAFIVISCGAPATTPTTPATTTTPTTPVTPKPTTPTATTPATTTAPTTPATTKSATPTKPTAPAMLRYGGILKMIEAGAPGTPIGWPAEIAGPAATSVQICLDQLIHERINGDFIPNVATSYDINPDPKNPSVTFHLRKGVKFHDGSTFNAEAVKWNFERIKTGVNVSVVRYWKSFDVLDDYTIRVNFTEWLNTNLRSFSGLAAVLMSPSAYESKGLEWVRWNMVGTHAFKQVEFTRDVRLRTVRFDDYWDTGKPYLQGIDIEYVKDELTRIALFRTGGGDVMGVSARVASELQAAGYTIINAPGGAQLLIPDSINPDSPWSNAKVRMAAEHAIDTEAIAKALGFGFYQPAYQIAPPTSKAYIPTLVGRKYDPAKAKQLLTEAGYPNGFKTKIIAASDVQRDVIVAFQSYLGAVGIQADLDFPEPAKMATIMTGTWNNALVFGGLINYPNFYAVLSLWLGIPTTFYKSLAKSDAYQNAFKATMASPLQEPALMQKAVQIFYDDAAVIPTYYAASLWATQKHVHDTGLGQKGATTSFFQQNAWMSK